MTQTLTDAGLAKTRKVSPRSILVTCIGSTIGKMGMASCELSTNQQINSIDIYPAFDNDFVYYNIQSAFPRYLREVAVQAVPILSKSSFEKLSASLTVLAEQKKIGRLFALLDERIDIQNKIIEDLKKLKSAIYTTLFAPIKADNKSLGEIADIVKGKQINGEELSEQGKFYVMNGGIEPSGYLDIFNVQPNTISISEGGNSCGYVQWNNTAFWSGGHCYTLQNIGNSVSNRYLYHYLKWKEHEIMALRIGSGLPNIQKKDLAKIEVPIPPLTYQHKIEKIVNTIEIKESTETELLQHLSSIKQYLLTKMFI